MKKNMRKSALRLRRSLGFTFIEVMVTVIILSVGIVGIYRAFLLSLNQQQYLLTRLYVMNFLTDELAKAESLWLSSGSFPYGSMGRISFPVDAQSDFYGQRAAVPLEGALEEGLDRINVEILWKDGKKEQTFTRSTLVYAEK